MFCLDEPDRHPAFSAANDRTLAFAERSSGRFVPFVRLDLNEDPIGEATRCLDAGARGIKLHPRAQKFHLNDERLAPVFELAADRGVPILIHGGRGLPPIADGLADLVERFETQLIIAHCGIADLAALANRFSGRPGVFFDTSVWSALDILDLFRLVAPEQVLYASDYPYGQQPGSLLLALRTAKIAGLNEAQTRAMFAGSAQADLQRRGAAAALAAAGPRVDLTAADVRPHPCVPLDGDAASLDASGRHDRRARARAERVRRALERPSRADRADSRAHPRRPRPLARAAGRRARRTFRVAGRAAFRMVHLANILAVTAGA